VTAEFPAITTATPVGARKKGKTFGVNSILDPKQSLDHLNLSHARAGVEIGDRPHQRFAACSLVLKDFTNGRRHFLFIGIEGNGELGGIVFRDLQSDDVIRVEIANFGHYAICIDSGLDFLCLVA
jgi:hypothetical protein